MQHELFVVSGRNHGDDDDTVLIISARSGTAASQLFRQTLREAQDVEDDYAEVYINTIIAVGRLLPDGLLQLNSDAIDIAQD